MKKLLSSILISLLLAFSLASCSVEPAEPFVLTSIVSVSNGEVQGLVQEGAIVWYGIPYAKAPVGDLRWSAPQDAESWEEVLDATTPNEPALQLAGGAAVGSEDALYLDVYAQEGGSYKKPVLVYLHGGNNQSGNTTEIPGFELVKTNDAVFVSVNYRLGLLGFNTLPAITDEGETANYALQDMAKALDWVKANIASFGGDPENIIISGFSAGGRDVMAMLISPLFEDKFDKAIVFSGGMTVADVDLSTQKIANAIAPLVVEDGKAADIESAVQFLLTDNQEVRDYLYTIDGARLAILMGNAGIRMSVFPHLYTDGVGLPKEGFSTDNYNDVPVLMLTGDTEFSMFNIFDGAYAAEEVTTKYSAEEIAAAKQFASIYGSDMYRIFNAQLSAEVMDKKYESDIYIAQINYSGFDSAYMDPGLTGFYSFHGIFVPMLSSVHNYVSYFPEAFNKEGYVAMADVFNNYLTNFLHTGNPNGGELAKWDAYSLSAPLSMVFDADETTAIVELKDDSTSYSKIMDAMDADDSIPEELKAFVIARVMNGRWFSAELDARYGNADLWK